MRDDSNASKSSEREPGSRAGGALTRDTLSVYCTAAAVVLATMLTWAGFPMNLGDTHEAQDALGNVTRWSGVDMKTGKIALLAALAAGGLTWAEASGVLRWDVGTVRLAAFAAAILSLLAALYGWIDVDPPVATAFGLYLAMVAAAVLVWFTWVRVAPLRRGARS